VFSWAGLLSPESYSRVLKERVIVVAADGGTVIGFGQLNPKTGDVEAVYVRPDGQGEGIGRRLLEDLEAQARARGIRALELSATLNAEPFYTRAGHPRRHAAVHRLPTGVELECVRMAKELSIASAHGAVDRHRPSSCRSPAPTDLTRGDGFVSAKGSRVRQRQCKSNTVSVGKVAVENPRTTTCP